MKLKEIVEMPEDIKDPNYMMWSEGYNDAIEEIGNINIEEASDGEIKELLENWNVTELFGLSYKLTKALRKEFIILKRGER